MNDDERTLFDPPPPPALGAADAGPTFRRGDPVTSILAGARALGESRPSILAALRVYADGIARTHEEGHRVHKARGGTLYPERFRHGVNWLVKAGYVQDSGERGRTERGASSIRWRWVDGMPVGDLEYVLPRRDPGGIG